MGATVVSHTIGSARMRASMGAGTTSGRVTEPILDALGQDGLGARRWRSVRNHAELLHEAEAVLDRPCLDLAPIAEADDVDSA